MGLSDDLLALIGRIRSLGTHVGKMHPLVQAFLITAASCGGVWLSELALKPLVSYAPEVGICWPTDGIMLAILLMSPRKSWLWIGLGYVVEQTIVQTWSPFGIAIDCFCNLLEMFLAAFCLPAFTGLSNWFEQPKLLVRFSAFAVVLSPLCAALIGGFYFRQHGVSPSYWIVVLRWETGDALGFALWTPLILCLFSKESYDMFRPGRLRWTVPLFAILLGTCWIIFHQQLYPIAFIAFPVLIVVVSVLGFPGSVLAVNALMIISASATLNGNGPFMFIQGAQEPYRIVALQVYLTLSMLMCFTIAITRLQRQTVETRLQQALQTMELLATRDVLTGLGNRRIFDSTLKAEWNRARREGTSIALLLLDADCFKIFNDLYGHLAGDDCLRQIAESLNACVQRAGDLTIRFGGEEFVALLAGTTLEQAASIAERIRAHVEARQIPHSGNPYSVVTVSIGCSAACPNEYLTPVTLIHRADQALYQAKQIGRNRVECAITLEHESVTGVNLGSGLPATI